MNLDDIRQILDLVREHDLAELEIERDGLKVRIRKSGHPVALMPAAVPVAATPAPAASGPVASPPSGPAPGPAGVADGLELAVIKSPIVGTYYRSAEPGAKAFVEVGDTVKKGQVLCIIEAMKLMNAPNLPVGQNIVLTFVHGTKSVSINLTHLTLPELKALRETVAIATDVAEPIVRERDRVAQEEKERGDFSNDRTYRPLPQVVIREGALASYDKSVLDRRSDVLPGESVQRLP